MTISTFNIPGKGNCHLLSVRAEALGGTHGWAELITLITIDILSLSETQTRNTCDMVSFGNVLAHKICCSVP